MLKNVVLMIAVVSLAVPVLADDVAAIRSVLDTQVAAWNDGDLEGFMDGYVNSEELVFTSGGNVRRGWQTTLDKYRERYGNATETMGHLAFADLEIHSVGPDAAWVLGRWELTYQDGASEGGVFTLVMTRTEEGWRVIHDHTSASSQ